jgi:hypothetical protein
MTLALPFSGRGLRCLLLALLLLTGTRPARAHNGDDHGAAPATAAQGVAFFTVAATSELHELVLRYAPIRAGEAAELRLFVSDFATNEPIHGARLTVSTSEAPILQLTATETAPGDYRLTGTFPADRAYALAVQVVRADGQADLLLLRPVAVGQTLAPAAQAAPTEPPWLTVRTGLVAVGSLLVGVGLTVLVLRRRRALPIDSSSR